MTKLNWERNRRDKKQWEKYFEGLSPFLVEQQKLIAVPVEGKKSNFERDEMRRALSLLNSLIQSRQFSDAPLSFRSSIVSVLKDVLQEYDLFDFARVDDHIVNTSLALFDRYRISLATFYGAKNIKHLALCARRGNYTPFSNVIVAALGTEFEIRNRLSFESLSEDLERMRKEKNGTAGDSIPVIDGSSESIGIEQIDSLIRFVNQVKQCIEEIDKI